MTLYKEGQGMPTRIGAIVLMTLVGAYAGICWYRWQLNVDSVINASALDWLLNGSFVGALVLFLGLTGLGIFLALYRSNAAEFLIEVDVELRKVVWPSVLPLFDPKAEAWGSTYVVIIVTVLSTIYIGIVDTFFEWSLAKHLLVWLLASS